MKILIAGDLVPQNRVTALFDQKKYAEVLQEVKQYTEESDYSIVNLEAPIVVSPNCEPIEKVGPNLKTNQSIIGALQYVGFDGVTLANNHLRDYGDWGVNDTLFQLKKAGIDTVGAGLDIREASVTLYKSMGGSIIALVNCCEHEFSIASMGNAGSNPLNPIRQYHAIQEARKKADYVIVITHGGIEHFNLPTPRMVETYRFFIDAGADAVVNHHQHCYSGYEVYKGKPIFYGLGNFCFDRPQHRNDFWNYGYMVQLDFDEGIKFRLIPYNQCSEEPAIKILSGEELNTVVSNVKDLNEIIANSELLEESVRNIYEESESCVLSWLEPYSGRLMSKLYDLKLLPSLISRKNAIRIKNCISCESHRDRLLSVLISKIK